MSNQSNNPEVVREVWEYLIDELRHRAAQTEPEDHPQVHAEKITIVNHLIRGYEDKFGELYPDTRNRL